MTIEFVSNDFSNRSVKERLKESLENTEILRGAVAFWTIDDNYFGDALVNALNHNDSFYCVDVSSPTDFDAIRKIDKKLNLTPAFHVHCKRFEPSKGVRENLLHSKIIVMDKFDGSAEIWVGSHNFTKYALSGINIESSVVIHFDANEANSDFKNNIISFLESVKRSPNTYPFNENSYYYFMALQDAARINWIKEYLKIQLNMDLGKEIEFCRTIEIKGKDLDKLDNSTIIVIGDDEKELSDIEGFSTKIIVHAHNDDGTEIFYRGYLRSRDRIDTKFSKDVQFGERRIGRKKSKKHNVFLEGVGVIKQTDLEEKGFYVNIQITQKIDFDNKIFVYSHPNFKDLWEQETKGNNEIFVPKPLNDFQKNFLPKLLYKVSKETILKDDIQANIALELFYKFFRSRVDEYIDDNRLATAFEYFLEFYENFITNINPNSKSKQPIIRELFYRFYKFRYFRYDEYSDDRELAIAFKSFLESYNRLQMNSADNIQGGLDPEELVRNYETQLEIPFTEGKSKLLSDKSSQYVQLFERRIYIVLGLITIKNQ